MIYTMTLNPSIDYIVHVDHLKLAAVNRMTKDFKLPGGKGINVSRILQRVGVASTALGFVGGFTGDFIKDWLQVENINCNFTAVNDDTRINVKLKAEKETEINGQGPELTVKEITELKETLAGLIKKDDIVIFSGSKAKNLAENFYQELIAIVRAKKADFVIDTTGNDLAQSLTFQPLLVKPNNYELAALYHTELNSIDEIIRYGKKLLTAGAQNVIVSMAEKGALLITDDGTYRSNVLKHPVKNSVGAGDSMIAGFIGSFSKNHDAIEAFRWGVACGSATTFSDDLAQADFIRELLPEVKITKI
ncbi:MAG TPA: 1-phosphofructokinase [Tetragenococcus sp.]|nr:1-phosphofructokinase [Tetragenococcus sp.]